jgi:cytochrome c5
MLAKTADQTADALIAFALPDTQLPRISAQPGPAAGNATPARVLPSTNPNKEIAAPDPPLPDGDGKELVVRMCTTCHGTAVFAKVRMGRVGWENEVAAMVERGAVGTEQEIQTVVDYLVKNFGLLK